MTSKMKVIFEAGDGVRVEREIKLPWNNMLVEDIAAFHGEEGVNTVVEVLAGEMHREFTEDFCKSVMQEFRKLA